MTIEVLIFSSFVEFVTSFFLCVTMYSGDDMKYYMHISSILDDMIEDVSYIKRKKTLVDMVKKEK